MNINESRCGTFAGKATHRPTILWLLVYPDGSDTGTEHSRYFDVTSELMSIESVESEVLDRLRSAREYEWDMTDEDMWVRENAPEIAKELGFKINRIVR